MADHGDDHQLGTRSAAAAMESRTSNRLLLVVADAATNEIDVKLVDDDELIAHGAGPCSLRFTERGAVTALARVTLHSLDEGIRRKAPAEVNLAVSWVVLPGRPGPVIDVAGTAYLFEPSELRPEEFRARRCDPFNTVDVPEVDEGPEPVGEPPEKPRRWVRPWASPTRFPFPSSGPRPRWASIAIGSMRSAATRSTLDTP